jgi:hypothetical protein
MDTILAVITIEVSGAGLTHRWGQYAIRFGWVDEGGDTLPWLEDRDQHAHDFFGYNYFSKVTFFIGLDRNMDKSVVETA